MTRQQIEQERRKQRALERLGSNNPVCVSCGEAGWSCLERHHIAGKRFDPDTAIICRNCHRKLSDRQKDHPADLGTQPDFLERLGHMLLGLADLFELLVQRFREFGHELISKAGQLHAKKRAAS
jgi:hypothetical protein